jgi:mitochondrial fission protein ELM1
VNQSIGISKALESELPHERVAISFQLRFKILRPLMRALANFFPLLLNRFTLTLFYRHDALPSKPPTLILSAGGNTLFANAAIARMYGVSNVFSGTTKGYRHKLVRLVFTVSPLENTTNNVVLDLPPANFSTAPGDKQTKSVRRFYALLVGGEGAGYHYQDADWRLLAAALGEISQREGSKWLLTTSRRTGEQFESLLRLAVPSECCERAVWYATEPAKVVKSFLSECEAVFCTEDSLTMISEAIYAHKPVITLQPEVMQPDSNDARALQKYADLGFIRRLKITELAGFSVSEQEFCQSYPDINAQIRKAVQERCL